MIRTLPEPQFLDRHLSTIPLKGDHFHPTPCDAAAVPRRTCARAADAQQDILERSKMQPRCRCA